MFDYNTGRKEENELILLWLPSICFESQVSCFEVLLQNSLIIHEEKSKEITTVSVVLYSMW
jgi:hypothetical protein